LPSDASDFENPNFEGDKNCKWQPKAEDSIEQIKIILEGTNEV